MTEEYSAYLNSEAWQAKRAQRLAISKYRCSACTKKKAIHVHHLTYERIFNEDMSDLMPLCEDHHKAAEDLIARGKLIRRGDVLFLASETLRLILGGINDDTPTHPSARNITQDKLLNNPLFNDLLYLPRDQFKAAVKRRISSHGVVVNNACALYDRMKRGPRMSKEERRKRRKERKLKRQLKHEDAVKSIGVCQGRPSLNGFKKPVRKWLPVSEAERHAAAYDRIGFV